jgi:hypothetical protein
MSDGHGRRSVIEKQVGVTDPRAGPATPTGVGERRHVVLSEHEREALSEIEFALRAEDGRFTRRFEFFQLHPPLVHAEPEPPSRRRERLDQALRWTSCGIAFALLSVFWWFVLMGGGELRPVAAVLVCPATILLLTAGLAPAPASYRRRNRAG